MKADRPHEFVLTGPERNVMPLRRSDELATVDRHGFMAVIAARELSDRASMDATATQQDWLACEDRIARTRAAAVGLLNRLGLELPKQ